MADAAGARGGDATEGGGASERSPPADPVATLEERLGVRLADRMRALAALTHKSWVNEHRDEPAEDNERLEFLGDAVVDLLVSHRLMERFPGAREGELSKMRSSVVDEAGLAAIARELRLGELLRLGRGEEMTGGREKASLLADALEAVFAAVYLEHGLGAAQAVLDRFLHETYARATAGTLDRDFKTQLQEVCQSRFRLSPRYRVTADHGPDHLKTFDVEVSVDGEVLGGGSGRSKKDAEQLAARQALGVLAARPQGALEPGAPLAPGPSSTGDAQGRAAPIPPAAPLAAEGAPAPPVAGPGATSPGPFPGLATPPDAKPPAPGRAPRRARAAARSRSEVSGASPGGAQAGPGPRPERTSRRSPAAARRPAPRARGAGGRPSAREAKAAASAKGSASGRPVPARPAGSATASPGAGTRKPRAAGRGGGRGGARPGPRGSRKGPRR
jgi:ribonuclease-3